MPTSLAIILSDTRFPSGQPPHSGGVEAACRTGLVKDLATLATFLRGRLRSAGSLGAHTAAAVCTRAAQPPVHTSLWRSVEAELDVRMWSPATRQVSRQLGGETLRLALTVSTDPRLDSLARATVAFSQQPHHCVALGAVAAVAGVGPEQAAASAAWASVAGPAFAAQQILRLDPATVSEIGVEMVPDVTRLASEAAWAAGRPLSDLPCYASPALDYLAEDHAAHSGSVFAS